MQYKILYWWFFLSKGNRWTKYFLHLKIWRPKPCHLIFAFLVALEGFSLLLSTQLTADLTPQWSGGFMFHSLSYIYAKPLFCCVETVSNNALNRRRIVVSDRLWAKVSTTLNTAFSLTNVYAKWRIHCLLIPSTPLLSHATSIYDRPKRACGGFGVFRESCQIWATRVSSFICVCPTDFKVSIPPLSPCFLRNRVRITLMKPLLCLNNIFPIRKQCFINTRNPVRSFI